MSVFKSVFLSLFSLLIYVSFSASTSDTKPISAEARKGNVVDNFSIEEMLVDDSTAFSGIEPGAIDYHSSWIYEKGPGLTPEGSEDRTYARLFNRGESRFICWEVTIEHPADSLHSNLDFEFRLFDEAGNKLAEDTSDSWIPSGQEFTNHNACWGYPNAYSWSLGQYYFELEAVTQSEIAQKTEAVRVAFEVF